MKNEHLVTIESLKPEKKPKRSKSMVETTEAETLPVEHDQEQGN